MSSKLEVLGVIPARGGSKAIPGKNIALLCGQPLLAYTCDAARASRTLTRVIVSTDDKAIAESAQQLGVEVPFMRPPDLSGDEVPMVDVLRHAVETLASQPYRPDVIVLLQPTSPLRRAEHIDAAVDLLASTGADSVVTVVEVPHQFHPLSVLKLEDGRLMRIAPGPPVTRRQDKPRLYARNGPAVVAVRRDVLVEANSLYGNDSRPLVMSPEESIDIDDPWDLELAGMILARRQMPRAD